MQDVGRELHVDARRGAGKGEPPPEQLGRGVEPGPAFPAPLRLAGPAGARGLPALGVSLGWAAGSVSGSLAHAGVPRSRTGSRGPLAGRPLARSGDGGVWLRRRERARSAAGGAGRRVWAWRHHPKGMELGADLLELAPEPRHGGGAEVPADGERRDHPLGPEQDGGLVDGLVDGHRERGGDRLLHLAALHAALERRGGAAGEVVDVDHVASAATGTATDQSEGTAITSQSRSPGRAGTHSSMSIMLMAKPVGSGRWWRSPWRRYSSRSQAWMPSARSPEGGCG